MFTSFVMHDAIAHEGRLCRPDYLNAHAAAPGGGREGEPLFAAYGDRVR
jgi:hypothetical protein